MKISVNNKILTLALILTLTLTVTITALPAVTAQQEITETKKTFPFIGIQPDPVGKGQQVLLHVGILTAFPPPANCPSDTCGSGWTGLEVIVTKPDGTTEKLGPFTTDRTGGTGTGYTPQQVGTYYFQTHFPAQECPATFFQFERMTFLTEGTIMEESYSENKSLTVQEEPIQYYPGHELPNEYWTRPIDGQLREWWRVGGNWLQGMDVQAPPYNMLWVKGNEYAPDTAHILWTKDIKGDGGLVGGEKYGPHAYSDGDAYEGEWNNPVIIDGTLFYNKYHTASSYGGTLYEPDVWEDGVFPGGENPPGVVAVDLHTGEELWYNDEFRINFGQIYQYTSMNQHGAHDYLVSTDGNTWKFYETCTGEWEYTIENVSSGNQYYGPLGEIMILNVDTHNNRMTLWDNTAIPRLAGGYGGTSEDMWRPYGKIVDGNTGYVLNVSIPSGLGSPGGISSGMSYKVYHDDRVVGVSYNLTQVTVWGLNLNETAGDIGEELFKETWNPPDDWEEGSVVIQFAGATNGREDGVIALWSKEFRRFYGFSTEDGKYMWTTESESYLDAYGWGAMEHTWMMAHGRLYSSGVAGIVYAYDLETGETDWTYECTDPYTEFLLANNWWQWITFITDGKVYMGHSEHSAMDPKPRGGPFVCLNATTGDVVWRANGLFRQTRWGGRAIIGDSIMATMDTYDGRVYAVGRGPSQTTISVQDDVVPQGSSVMIKGTVTDVSPGTEEPALTMRFPNGVPAVADENMNEWMLYVYKQFERPENVEGVTVTIDAVNPDGEWEHIDTVTSDDSGLYKKTWTPPSEGDYTIIATFMGSDSYYSSYAETAVSVDPAPEETVSPTEQPAWYEEPASPTEQPTWYQEPPPTVSPTEQPEWYQKPDNTLLIVAIVIAIVIGLVNLWMHLQKQK